MKTALILGVAALAVYVVWQHGVASAATGAGSTASAPLGGTNAPYPTRLPTAPAAAAPLTDPLQIANQALTLESTIQRYLAGGQIASGGPYATGLTPSQGATLARNGYVVIGTLAFKPGPNRGGTTAASGSGVAVSSGGLAPASPGQYGSLVATR